MEIDPRYFRPTEVDYLLADPSRAQAALDWQPRIHFPDLVRMMVDADMEQLGLASPGEGKRILAERHGAWHQW